MREEMNYKFESITKVAKHDTFMPSMTYYLSTKNDFTRKHSFGGINNGRI